MTEHVCACALRGMLGDRVTRGDLIQLMIADDDGADAGQRAGKLIEKWIAFGPLVPTYKTKSEPIPGQFKKFFPYSDDPYGYCAHVNRVPGQTGEWKTTKIVMGPHEVPPGWEQDYCDKTVEWFSIAAVGAVADRMKEKGFLSEPMAKWLQMDNDADEWIDRPEAQDLADRLGYRTPADIFKNLTANWLQPCLRAQDAKVNWTKLRPILKAKQEQADRRATRRGRGGSRLSVVERKAQGS